MTDEAIWKWLGRQSAQLFVTACLGVLTFFIFHWTGQSDFLTGLFVGLVAMDVWHGLKEKEAKNG